MENKNRKIIYGILVALSVLALILASRVFSERRQSLKVVFFDVGQGDSILIEQGSTQILIDGGKDGKLLLQKLGKHVPFWDRDIEMVVETHPDQDHIGGLIDVFKSYHVETVLKTNMLSDSQTFKKLEEMISEEKSETVEALSGKKLVLPGGAEAEVIFPFAGVESVKETNAASVVLKLVYGGNKFLFTGDLPSEQEEEIVAKGIDVRVDVLKVGHHGSKYSSGDIFLEAVSPRDAIISVGKNNTYGHPNPEALQRLTKYKANILRTDEVGDIVYECPSLQEKCQMADK